LLTTIRRLLKNGLIFYLVLCSLLLGFFTSDSMAILIPSVLPGAQGSSVTHRQSELERIQVLLESKLISQRLSDLGLTADEIQARLAEASVMAGRTRRRRLSPRSCVGGTYPPGGKIRPGMT